MNSDSVPPFTPVPPPRRSRFSRFSLRAPEGRSNAAALGMALGAAGAAYAIPEAVTRALVLLGCSVSLYLVGLFQERPRK